MLKQFTTLLFGYDVFISYPYADGKQYAEELERRLTNLDLACFLDKEELPYGGTLTGSLERAIRRSRAIVLVGTRAVREGRRSHATGHKYRSDNDAGSVQEGA